MLTTRPMRRSGKTLSEMKRKKEKRKKKKEKENKKIRIKEE